MKRSSTSRSTAKATEKGSRKKSTESTAAVPETKALATVLPPVSIEELEAALNRRLTSLDAEKARLESELAAIDAALAAELSSDSDSMTPEFAKVMEVAAPAAPATRSKRAPAVSQSSGIAEEKVAEVATPAVRSEDSPSPKVIAQASAPASVVVVPSDPSIRKPTLGSRILAILTKEHPNALNAKQLVEKMVGSEWGVPTPIAVLQSMRALRVNGVLWSGDGEAFGLTDVGRKRARAS